MSGLGEWDDDVPVYDLGNAPVAVVDDSGRPCGLVDSRAVLAALAGTPADGRPPADPLDGRTELLEGSRG